MLICWPRISQIEDEKEEFFGHRLEGSQKKTKGMKRGSRAKSMELENFR